MVESGGTKSTWSFSDREEILDLPGLNPFEITNLKKEELHKRLSSVSIREYSCFFYGSGCENKKGASIITELLKELGFSLNHIHVNTDLLAACRALLGQQPGTVGIIGTGAISAIYNGEKVVQTYSGLGALLGDEGSGFDLGKRLLKAYYYNKLGREINQEIETYFGGKEQIIPIVYGFNGRMKVAGLTKILGKYRETATLQLILRHAFEDFYQTALYPIANKGEVSLVGSIAFHFEKEINAILLEKGYSVRKILPSAAEELLAYHKKFLF